MCARIIVAKSPKGLYKRRLLIPTATSIQLSSHIAKSLVNRRLLQDPSHSILHISRCAKQTCTYPSTSPHNIPDNSQFLAARKNLIFSISVFSNTFKHSVIPLILCVSLSFSENFPFTKGYSQLSRQIVVRPHSFVIRKPRCINFTYNTS